MTRSSRSPRRLIDGPFGDTRHLYDIINVLVNYYELSKTYDIDGHVSEEYFHTVFGTAIYPIGKAFSYGCWCQIRTPFRDEWYTILGKKNDFSCN